MAVESNKSTTRSFRLSMLDFAILIANVLEGATHTEVGYEDAEVPYEKFIARMRKANVTINVDELESMLWSANLLNEQGDFWHPQGISLDSFITRILNDPKLKFDYVYNFIKE